MRPLRAILLTGALLFMASTGSAQEKTPPAKPEAAPLVDIDDLVGESQQTIRGEGRTGIVWWIPVDFWEASARQTGDSTSQFQSLRDYTMVVVAAGNVGTFGSIQWISEKDLRSSIRLRDEAGTEYEPFRTVSGDVAVFAAVIRPVLINALGPLGQHMEVFLFPARDAKGKFISDAKTPGKFSIVLNEIEGFGASLHEWNLPLSSLSPPKFCPQGKEKVLANWKFCPWHGNKLDGATETPN